MISHERRTSLALRILKAGALTVRKVSAKVTNDQVKDLPPDEQPFMYSTGNWGMGYVMIKGLVSNTGLMEDMGNVLAKEVVHKWPQGVDFVAGNVTGGMIPSWIVKRNLDEILGKDVPFIYIRELRKLGGHKELITGLKNSNILPGADGIDGEELVNFAGTITNGGLVLREAGLSCTKGMCFLYYDNPESHKKLEKAGMEMACILTLTQLIEVAEDHGTHPLPLLKEYRRYLENPLQWQAERGLTPVEKGGTL